MEKARLTNRMTWAQVGTKRRSPNWIRKDTFVAMAYDLGNASAPAPHPHEGPLHPRNKWKLGKTSPLAGIAVAYGGPVISISFCDVDCDTRTLNLVFDGELLRGETVIV